MRHFLSLFAAAALFCGSSPGWSAAPAPGVVHIRGTIRGLAGNVLTVQSAAGLVRVSLTPASKVESLVPSNLSHIKNGSFVGITSVPLPNGSQRAVEIHLFPQSMAGAGEGTRPWDWPGAHPRTAAAGTRTASRMTNGTVSNLRAAGGQAARSRMTNGTIRIQPGRSAVTVRYRTGAATGSQTIIIPAHIPIVTFAPGSRADLKPRAHVFLMAMRGPNGKLTARSVLVGRNELAPPM